MTSYSSGLTATGCPACRLRDASSLSGKKRLSVPSQRTNRSRTAALPASACRSGRSTDTVVPIALKRTRYMPAGQARSGGSGPSHGSLGATIPEAIAIASLITRSPVVEEAIPLVRRRRRCRRGRGGRRRRRRIALGRRSHLVPGHQPAQQAEAQHGEDRDALLEDVQAADGLGLARCRATAAP